MEMVKKKSGKLKGVQPTVEEIIHADIATLEKYFAEGWDINKVMEGKSADDLPITVALINNNMEVVEWLVKHGVELNDKKDPAFLNAVRYSDEKIIRYIVENGAEINVVNSVKSDAFVAAVYGKKFKNFPLIHELGHTVQKYGGQAFRKTVADNNYKAMEFFIKNGVDINYNLADMVYPFKPTPLCVAARYVDLEMCKYLVAHGADITIPENDGMRPYSIAIEKGDMEMAEYFKALEPAEYHSLQNKLDKLKSYHLTKSVFSFLQGDNLHVEAENCGFKYVDFFKLIDTVPMKVGRKKLLRISKASGDYDEILLVWNPKTKKLAFYDQEHGDFADICEFEEFLEQPGFYLNKILGAEFE